MRLGIRRDLRWRGSTCAADEVGAVRVEVQDLETLRHIHGLAEIAGQAAVEAREQHFATAERQLTRLLECDERLAGSRTPGDRDAPPTPKQSEQTVLLLR